MKKIITVIFLLTIKNSDAQKKYTFIVAPKYIDCQIENKNTIVGYSTDGYDERSGDFYDISGKMIFEKATKIKMYNNGIIGFHDSKNNYCFLNKENTIIKTNQKITNKNVMSNGDGFITYKNNENKLIFIDFNGNEIAKPQNLDLEKYSFVKYLGHNNWAIKHKNTEDDDLDIDWLLYNNCGLLTPQGIAVEPKEQYFINEYINRTAEVFNENQKYGFLKVDGTYLIKPILEQSNWDMNANQQFNIFIKDNKKALIFDNGNAVTEPVYDLENIVFPFKDLFFLTQNGKYGAFDAKGKIIIPFEFDDHIDAYETISRIKVKELHQLYGYEDLSGKTIVTAQYSWAESFYKNLGIVVNTQKKYSVIDKSGTLQLPFVFDEIKFTSRDKLFIVKQNDKLGVITLE
jgi:hypothetical protein